MSEPRFNGLVELSGLGTKKSIFFKFHGNYTFTHPGFLVKPGMTHLGNGCNCHSCESRNPCLLAME
ncbi:hypothetical protein MBAV_000651 [Candidatus Magnetobacterium bavaricum]|uniref:Uncharacterized protein n=1 Tax=Candidatus Magnetobacterium bavaricum TaxID=29290 RepID=A0A0F3GZ44_9BACT|nr:hypothetical protein MBAV_000651 [Candidatus Magnetobacterium bavaricum]